MSRAKAPVAREWCGYVRVSKINGREGDAFMSPDQQESAIRREVPGPVVKMFKDLDFTGTNTNRPDLQAMLAWLREDPRGRGVGVYDYSRLSRKMKDCLALAAEINDMGAVLLSIKERIDTSTATGEHMFHQFASMYHLQARQIGERWQLVQTDRVEKGLPSGGPVRFGYEQPIGKDGKRERVQRPHPVNGPVLAEMYEDFINGLGAMKIATKLNERGTLTGRGRPWHLASVIRTLDSGFGAGKLRIVSSGTEEWEQGSQEPVITEDQWERYLRVRRGRRVKAARHKSPKWFLAGIATCGLCGANMTVSSYADPTSLVACGRYKNTRTCTGTWIKRSSVETIVGWWLGTRVDELARHAGSTKARDKAHGKAVATADAAQAKIDKLSRERISTVRASDDLSAAEYREALAQIEAETDAARVTLVDAQAESDRLAPVGDVYETLIRYGEEHPDPAEYNMLLSRVIKTVEIYKDKLTIVPVLGKPHDVPRL